jgi:hypothetical protein
LWRDLLVVLGTGVLVVLLNGGGLFGAARGAAAMLTLGALVLNADRQLRRDREAHERFIRELDAKSGKNH